MDLSNLIRRQMVCALLPKVSPQPLFAEVHVALRELADTVVPGVDLTADTWLFQRLAETLDRRLLSCLAKQEPGPPPGPISVNLRLATLLSPEFLKFDHDFRRQTSTPVIVELQLIDIFAELGAYLFIREFVRERGYLMCIDGLHYLHLPLIDRKRLGADLVKMIWSPDLLDVLNEARREELKSAIKRIGVDRMILCRCDSAEAVRWGQSLGIRLFQGHYVEFPPARRAPAGDRGCAPGPAQRRRLVTGADRQEGGSNTRFPALTWRAHSGRPLARHGRGTAARAAPRAARGPWHDPPPGRKPHPPCASHGASLFAEYPTAAALS